MENKSTAIISGSIELSSIDKQRLVPGKDGKSYLNITGFISSESKYGNNIWITQSISKEDRESGQKAPSLGNGAVKWINPDNPIKVATRDEVTNSQQNQDRGVDLPF